MKKKTILLAGLKESWAFDVPSYFFKQITNALTAFCILMKKPPQTEQKRFLEKMGFTARKVKLCRNSSTLKFAFFDEAENG